MGTGVYFEDAKRPGSKANRLPSSSTEIKHSGPVPYVAIRLHVFVLNQLSTRIILSLLYENREYSRRDPSL
jgi:hypothetical protein